MKDADVAISMDGKGRWIDNVFIERLWRSVKYEEVYLHAYANGTEARTALTRYFRFYNAVRSHQSHRLSDAGRGVLRRARRLDAGGGVESDDRQPLQHGDFRGYRRSGYSACTR